MRLFAIDVPAALDPAINACRDHFRLAAILSALVNILYLAPTLYMMQVYDRAVPTGGVTTLLWLTAVVVFALATLVILDMLRSRVMLRASLRLDKILSASILEHVIGQQSKISKSARPQEALREFDNLRQAIAGTSAIALFDIPWTPIYIFVAFLVHPAIGALAIVGSLLLLGITMANEQTNRTSSVAALQAMSAAYVAQERVVQRSELIRALGMRRAMIARLLGERQRSLQLTSERQFANGRFASGAKFLRLVLQSIALGLGAWLAIAHQISAGSIIAASVLINRAVQPIESLVGSWASIGQARQAIASLGTLLAPDGNDHGTRFDLPAPRGYITLKDVGVRAPDHGARPLLANISFTVEAGDFVGIIGPSGAGKSTLARVLAAALTPDVGTVRVDGSDMLDWDAEQLARHIGYLPQDAGLLPGTIAENISRFAGSEGDTAELSGRVLAAAHLAGVHDLIVALPGGYDRRIGWGAEELSTGQRQRVALARALYGDPTVLVLDEPNAALDAEGENALTQAIATVRENGRTVFMITHRAPLLAGANKLALLVNGTLGLFGPYQEVIETLQKRGAKPALAEAG